MIDETDRSDTRRRTRLAVIGAFAGGGDSTGSSTTRASTTFVQDGTTTPERDAPARGDCPEGAAPQDGGSSTTPS